MIIDATDMILGRLASYCAKKALEGEEVIIINAEKAIVSGNRTAIYRRYKFKNKVGTVTRGPYSSRMPDRLVRRTIRGMISWKTPKGKKAFKNVKVHIGDPETIKGKRMKLEECSRDRLRSEKYLTIMEISKWLGAM